MVCRYQVRLVFAGRSQTVPSGLLVAEFWEQQMLGEKDIDLEQKTSLLEPGSRLESAAIRIRTAKLPRV